MGDLHPSRISGRRPSLLGQVAEDLPYAVVYDLAGDKIKALRFFGLAQGVVEQLTT
jgi:hypothetical protein